MTNHYTAEDPKTENCTQVEERYYVEWKGSEVSDTPEVFTKYCLFYKGFKSLKSARRTLDQARTARNRPYETYRITKTTKTIEIKTTTKVEVVDEQPI